jgi:flagellar hook-associated protein 2
MSSDLLSALNKNGSGLNLRELSKTLAAAETAPKINALQTKLESGSVKLSVLGQVRAQFSALSGVLAEIAGNPVLTVTTSSAAILPKVVDRNKLVSGTVPFEVQTLASRQVLEFGGFSSAKDIVEAGKLTIEFGKWDAAPATGFSGDASREAVALDIPSGATLQDLATLLSSVSGVTARVLNKGDGSFSLGIVSETGASSGLRLTAAQGDGSGTVALSTLDTTTTNAARQIQAAGDAKVIVDGISVARPTNVLKDVLPGMDITISSVTSGTLTVGRDPSVARESISKLVDGLNSTIGLLKSVTQRGVGGTTPGDLAGDRNIEALEQSLRKLIATPLQGYGDRPISLVDLGVATQRDGLFRFDPPAFDRTFAARSGDFDALLGDSLRSLAEGTVVRGVPGATLAPGDYAFKIADDGSATLGGYGMLGLDLGAGRRTFIALAGPVQGLTMTVEPGVTSSTVRFGRSLVASLAQMLAEAGASNGTIGRRETEIGSATTANQERIDALEARAAVMEKRYLTKFAAMEQTITQMKSTGSYIQNLVDLWSKK